MMNPLAKIEFFGIHAGGKRSYVSRSIGDCAKKLKELNKKGMKHARMRQVCYGNDPRDTRYVIIY